MTPARHENTNGKAVPPPRRLSEAHRRQLRASAISDDVVTTAGLFTASDPEEIRRLLGWRVAADPVFTCLAFPYFAASGEPTDFVRLRPDRPRRDGDTGKPIRYESPSGRTNQAYFVPGTHTQLTDPAEPIILTEGEKKALAAVSAGLPAVGLVGVDGWSRKRERDADGRPDGPRELLADLDVLPWKGRVVFIAFDSDAVTNPNVSRAETALAATLEKQGAVVRLVRLPSGPGGAKQGLDDYLAAHGPETLRDLLASARPIDRPAKTLLPEYTPFPVEELPTPAREFVKATAQALGCDPAFVGLPVLSVLASAIGNSRVVQLKRGWREPSILWTAVVADSGTLKSPAWESATRPAYARQRRLLNDYLAEKALHDAAEEEHKAAVKAFRADEAPPPANPRPRRYTSAASPRT